MRSLALLASAALLASCSKASEPRPSPPPAIEPAPPAAPPSADLQEETCLNAWLSRRGLNAYGDPPGRMYPGGTPLFDERTGARVDRREYVYGRHPDAKQDCAPAR